jgi:anion-transporting  ArsA/GET3 family ATPase
MIPLSTLVLNKKLLVCVGSGGVGKTTTAAALGLFAAREGRRVVVLTIDPSWRLKDLLHISWQDPNPQAVPLTSDYSGVLHALVLDPKGTFDRLIGKFSPSVEAAETLLKNRLYQNISGTLAGSQEYMAVEKLHELVSEQSFDLVIVDTPPSYHTLDFLNAPQRLATLLTSGALEVLKDPSQILVRSGSRLATITLGAILKGLKRFTGLDVLHDVNEFLSKIEGLSTGFRERAESVSSLLRQEQTAFILVTSPELLAVEETIRFARRTQELELPLAGAVVNRLFPRSFIKPVPLTSLPLNHQSLGQKLLSIHHDFRTLALQQQEALRLLVRGIRPLPILARVPVLEEEPVELAQLEAMARHLCCKRGVKRQRV